MTKDCPENQQFILEIDDKPSGIIDREKLLKELGVDLEKLQIRWFVLFSKIVFLFVVKLKFANSIFFF